MGSLSASGATTLRPRGIRDGHVRAPAGIHVGQRETRELCRPRIHFVGDAVDADPEQTAVQPDGGHGLHRYRARAPADFDFERHERSFPAACAAPQALVARRPRGGRAMRPEP